MKRHGFLPLAVAVIVSGLPFVSSAPAIAAYAFTSHTFTPCGASGISGPTQSQCKSSYSTTWDESDSNFTVSSGIQLWMVPATAKYRFRIAGGSSPIQGRGRVIEMEISLTEGQQLKILVGQKSSCYLAEGCGGAGGTFVVDTYSNIIGVAGGGGGYGVDATGSTTSTGGAGYGTVNSYAGAPANGGNGGGKGSNGDGNSGAGYSGDGSTNSSGVAGPLAFIRGGTASEGYDQPRSGRLSASIGNGGFGGGGGAWLNADGGNYTRSGGGGGYSGGGAGGYGGGKAASGGGGGASFISASATAANWSYGFNPINSDGYVIVTSLGPSLITFAPRTTLTNSSSITYDLTFSEAVTGLASNDFSKSGTGSSTCTIGSPSGSGTSYTVTLSGCSPGTVVLTMNSGAVSNSSSQTAPGSNTAAATVVIDQTAPSISTVLAPSNATYIPGGALDFTVNFSESVTVTGSPRLTLTVGSLTKYATFVSLTDSKTATFRYTVGTASGEFDTDGIAISTNLDPNGGSIADLATNTQSNFGFSAPTLTSVLVAQTPAAPTITSITPSSGTLSVAFTAGAPNGSAITNYQYSTDNGANWKDRANGTTASPLVITTVSQSASNLANGTAYNVKIRAVNAAGSGDSSTAVSATPSAVVITGDATLTTTYGSAASTGTYSSDGGTGPYTYTLSATPSGVSISGAVVTASASTAAGTYTQNVISTDSAGTPQTGLKQLVITVNKASTTITISLPSATTDAPLGGAITITATVSQAGSVNFKLGGSSISGCSSVASSAGTATCSWTPGALGGASLTAVLTPTDSNNYDPATTSTLAITVVNGVTTLALSLAGGITQTPKGRSIVITATVDQVGRISFFADGKRIPRCYNKAVSGATKTCTWKPAVQKQVTLTSRLNPTNSAYSNATTSLKVWVVRRTGTR